MFREFNVKFEDVEMLGGADNILEGTEVTKVIMKGDNKMSSLQSALKNCKELDSIDGGLDLNGVENINEILEDTPLVKKIDIKNVNNEDITTKNAFNNVDEIGIGGNLYNKKALQNVLASKEWTFEGFEYKDEVENNITTKEVNVVDNDKITIQDTLEQKAKGIEIEGQTYENLINGEGEINLIDELTIESIDGNKEFNTTLEQEVCVEVIEGETYQNLVNGKGEHKLTDIFSTTWTESNNSIDNAPNIIEIPEVWGNTVQGFPRVVTNKDLVNHINGLGFSNLIYEYVNDKTIKCTIDGSWGSNDFINKISNNNKLALKLKPNTKYSFASSVSFTINSWIVSTESILLDLNNKSNGTFTTSSDGLVAIGLRYKGEFDFILVEGDVIPSSPTFGSEDIKSVGDLYVDENGEAILDEEGNEQYKLELETHNENLNIIDEEVVVDYGKYVTVTLDNSKFEEGVKYEIVFKIISNTLEYGVEDFSPNHICPLSGGYIPMGGAGFIGEVRGIKTGTNVVDRKNNYTFRFDSYKSTYGQARIRIAVYKSDILTNKPYIPSQSSKTTILMPCQLSRIISGEYNGSYLTECDKLYYDISSNKYLIEKNISEYTTPNINYQGELNITLNLPSDMVSSNNNYDNYPFIIQNAKVRGWSRPTDSYFGVKRYNKDTHVRLATSNTFTNEEVSSFLSNKKILYITSSPQVIETKILEKLSLETYSQNIYISINSEVQPSQMSIVNKQTILSPLSLQANTDYTLQLDSVGKNDKNITVNLGGTETTIQPTNDTKKHHKVVVRTPATLTNDTLELSGKGITVNDVMLFEGGNNVIKQKVEYVEGIESIGELQGDGTYKIDILTESSTLKGLTKGVGTQVAPKRFMIESKNGSWTQGGILASSTYKKLDTPYTVCMKVISKKLLDNNYSFAGSWAGSTNAFVNYMNDLEVGVVYKKSITPQAEVKEGDTICLFQFNNKAVNGQHMEIEIWLEEDVVKSETQIVLPQQLRKIGDVADKLYWDEDKGHYCIDKSIDDNYEILNDSIIIDLPNLNKKYVLNSYNPKTYIKFSNLNLKPSRMLLETDIHKYNVVELKPNEKYTMQFNCIEKSDNPIKLDLDGIAKNVNPTLGLNHIEISTGSISDNLLKLSGSGNKISNIMLVEGEMNQYPKYFDGIQSVGVLENGKYRIDIKTNEGFNISIKTDSPLKKNDKLYWNNSNKRYEIDRNGEIEILIVEGEVIDLPRLYQRETANIKIETGNIKPSKIKIEYLDIN